MKLSVRGLGSAMAILFFLIVFIVGLVNTFFPGYGIGFLALLDSIYPGYTFGKWGFGGVIVASLYAALDGLIVGVVFAWLYNRMSK
jgi:hypothetical protein